MIYIGEREAYAGHRKGGATVTCESAMVGYLF